MEDRGDLGPSASCSARNFMKDRLEFLFPRRIFSQIIEIIT